MPEISVLCPTRDREQLLRQSYDSLLGNAADPDNFEFLIAVDPDDNAERFYLPQVTWWIAPERHGYQRNHEYYNGLATLSSARWLMLWNDDCTMRTQGWDERILACPCDRVLWPYVNHHETGNLFPVWPRAWSAAAGFVSRASGTDYFISQAARSIGAEQRVDIRIYHDRFDITGANRDQTYQDGSARAQAEGWGADAREPEALAARKLFAETAARIIQGNT